MKRVASLLTLLVLELCACAPATQVLVGAQRPPISPADVRIYSEAPPRFQEIALLTASSHSFLGTGGQKSIDTVIGQLKQRAAALGANGVILEGFTDRESGSLGAGGGSDSYSRRSSVGVGLGGSLGVFKKTGQGRAIYVSPDPAPAR